MEIKRERNGKTPCQRTDAGRTIVELWFLVKGSKSKIAKRFKLRDEELNHYGILHPLFLLIKILSKLHCISQQVLFGFVFPSCIDPLCPGGRNVPGRHKVTAGMRGATRGMQVAK